MILTRQQHWELRCRREGEAGRDYRPDASVLAIIELDALEHGIHPTWIQFWMDEGDPGRWANLCYVIAHYEKDDEQMRNTWSKPTGVRT